MGTAGTRDRVARLSTVLLTASFAACTTIVIENPGSGGGSASGGMAGGTNEAGASADGGAASADGGSTTGGTAPTDGGKAGSGGVSGSSAGSGGGGTSAGGGGTSAGGGGTSAGSGDGGSGGTDNNTGGPSVCDGKTFALPPGEAYIDNFETTTRLSGWFAFSDTKPPNMPQPARIMPGALSTAYAGHFHATGIKSSKMMGYGAGFGFGLVDPAKSNCVDLSSFKGMSFWIKGTAGPTNTLKYQVISALTQPADTAPAGDCPSSSSPCAFKHPARTITLTASWTQQVVYFADLAPASAFVASKVMGFNLLTDGPDYDVQLDEVTFFADTPPSGPLTP